MQATPKKTSKITHADSIYRKLFSKMSQSTHYASEIKARSEIGNKILK